MTPEATAAREAVRRVWPGAWAGFDLARYAWMGDHVIYVSLYEGDETIITRGSTEGDAWLAAAAGLEGRDGE